MSEFTLEDRGDGHFALSGEMTFDTAEKILAASGDMFDEHTQLEVDLSEVTESDSAGLALLLEWVTWANHSVREIRFTGMPERVLAPPEDQ
jgi:phospholipid transport system transporter-binding protein